MNYTDILIDIRKIVRALNLESKRIQKEHGVSIPQLLCIGFLYECAGHQSTHKAVAGFLKLNKSTVTGIIGRLEKKGLVNRLPKTGDRRVTYIGLTPEGIGILQNSPGLLHQKLAASLRELPEEKLSSIHSSLSVLISSLGIEEIDASPLLAINVPIES
jgi:DNA-binding MarR family transcriptional regulator